MDGVVATAVVDESVSEEISSKAFHIFISYRVRTDADLAEKLCDKLQSLSILNEQRDIRVRCFLDKQNLTQGQDFETEFMAGLNGSCLFLPLVSEECLRSMLSLQPGGEDNVVREWETALAMRAKKEIDIIPILVGTIERTGDGSSLYRRFSAFWMANEIPQALISNSPSGRTAQETVSSLFRLQGIFLNPTELAEKVSSIQSRFSADVWPKYRPFWANQDDLGAEPILSCVQCLKDFTRSSNADGSCRFHLSDGPGQTMSTSKYTCCGSPDPERGCVRNKHRAKHHNDFKYGQHRVWMNSIRGYTNTAEAIAEVFVGADNSFGWSGSRESVAEVGLTKGNLDYSNKLYVYGFSRNTAWFNVFSKDELALVDDKKPIFQLKNQSGTWAAAHWLVFDDEVCGVQISCGSRTTVNPRIRRIRIAWPESDEGMGPKTVSVDYEDTPVFGEKPLLPSTNHTFPVKNVRIAGPTLVTPVPRKRDTTLPSWSSPDCPLKLKISDVEARHSSYADKDFIEVKAVVINTWNEASSVLDARGFARLRDDNSNPTPLLFPETPAPDEDDDETWVTVTRKWEAIRRVEAKGEAPPPPPPPTVVSTPFRPVKPGSRPAFAPPPVYRPIHVEPPGLPLVVPPNGGLTLTLTAAIPTRRYGGKNVSTTWLNFSWIGMKTKAPLLIDFELEDARGRVFGAMAEVVLPKVKLRVPEDLTEFWLPCDDLDQFARVMLNISMKDLFSRDGDSPTGPTPRDGIYPAFKLTCDTFSYDLCVGHLRFFVLLAAAAAAAKGKPTTSGAVSVDVTEQLFGDRTTMSGTTVRSVAFVDLGRKVVYGIRFELWNSAMHSVGYFAVPAYGDALVDADKAAEVGMEPSDVDVDEAEADLEWRIEGPPREWTPSGGDVPEGLVQSTAPVAQRVSFGEQDAKDARGGGGGDRAAGAAAVVDITALVEALRPAIRSEVEAAVEKVVRREIEALESRLAGMARDERSAAVASLERSVNEAATASAAVTVRQIERKLASAAAGSGPV